jgi:parallel beta helix pectate lyase-like protein
VIGNSSLISPATIRNNGDTGVNASAPAAVTLPSGGKIHGNGTAGAVYAGPGRIQLAGTEVYNNGLAPVGVHASNPGGVVAIQGALVQLASANVHDNGGSGVYLRLNATGVFTNTTVQSNPGGGLNLNQGSLAELSVLVGPNVLQTNGGGTIGDVNCDAYSQVFGDLSGVATNKCPLKGGK